MDGSQTGLLIAAIVIGFPFAFAAILFAVMSILSAVGGWGRLAERFRGPAPTGGMSGKSGSFGLIYYRFVLNIAPSPQGLGLSVMPFFRFAHPPLLIPWSELHNVREASTLFGPAVSFEVGQPALARLRLPRAALDGYPGPISGSGA